MCVCVYSPPSTGLVCKILDLQRYKDTRKTFTIAESVVGMHIIVLTRKGAKKGIASQGQRTLFFMLSVKKQSRHFYHIKQSGTFNRDVTGRKAV